MVSTLITYFSQQYNLDYKQAKIKNELLETIVSGQEAVSLDNPDVANLAVKISLNDYGRDYSLFVEAPNESDFLKAIAGFFKFAGTPDQVKGSYRLVDLVLADLGKRTERNLLQAFSGRAVVPLEKK
ncbi:MAG: hypothetical protein V1866_04740 [archaeon]